MNITKIEIIRPIWNNKKEMAVGIAEYKMMGDCLAVEIMCRNKDKVRHFPKPYYISTAKAMTYPVQIVKGTRLRVIPLKDFQQ